MRKFYSVVFTCALLASVVACQRSCACGGCGAGPLPAKVVTALEKEKEKNEMPAMPPGCDTIVERIGAETEKIGACATHEDCHAILAGIPIVGCFLAVNKSKDPAGLRAAIADYKNVPCRPPVEFRCVDPAENPTSCREGYCRLGN